MAREWKRKDVKRVVGGVRTGAEALDDIASQLQGTWPVAQGPLERTAEASEQIAASSRSQVAIALDGAGGADGWAASPAAGAVVGPEQVIRSLTRWQGNDTTSLVRALRASFEQTSVQGRTRLRYRGAGRVWTGAGSTPTVGAGARVLRRISPGLQDVLDLLERVSPVDPAADGVAARSTAALIHDRLDSYAEELGRGFGAREGRLRAIRDDLRGPVAGALGGALGRLAGDLGVLGGGVGSEEEELLVDDFLVLVDYVYALDGTPVPVAAGGLGPTQWREGVEDELGAVTDLLSELRRRLRVEGVGDSRLETRYVRVSGARQSVGDVLGWTEELVQRTAPQLLGAVARQDAQAAIEAELAELRRWFGAVTGLSLFTRSALLTDSLDDVRRGLRRLTTALRRA